MLILISDLHVKKLPAKTCSYKHFDQLTSRPAWLGSGKWSSSILVMNLVP